MATVTRRDVIVTLMADVADLKDHSRRTTLQLGRVGANLETLVGQVEELTDLSREGTKKLERIGKTLSKLAERF